MKIVFDEPRNETFPLDGGADFASSHFDMRPGRIVSGSNMEMVSGRRGYSRMGGFERCAGDVLPSTTRVAYLELDSPSGAIAIGDVFSSGTIDVTALEESATPLTGDILAFATQEGEQVPDDELFSGASHSFISSQEIIDTSILTVDEINGFNIQAIEQTRDNVPEIPGTGTVDGGFRLHGKNYAFRDGVFYEGEENSWTAVTLPHVLYFKEGTVEFTVGDTITDGTETATIASITHQAGVWDSGEAAADQATGYFTITGASGSFTLDAVLSDSGSGAAKVAAVNYQYTLTPGGRYRTLKPHNFTNLVDNESMFGVDGINEAFEFDGTNYIPIFHPDTTDVPFDLNIHQERLQLAYPGGQWQYSVSGKPRVFNSLLGSGVWSTGSEITGSKVIHGNAQAVFCENSTWLLLGDGIYSDETATRNWQFYEHDHNVGALQWSVAERGYAFFVSDSELRYLRSTDTTAGYRSDPILTEFQKYISDNAPTIVCSLWCKKKSQYRLFFENGRAAFVTFDGGKPKGGMPIEYPIPIKNCWSAVEDGVEKMFFISDSGYLYRMDSGTTFDDEPIDGSFRLPFYHYGSPRYDKRFPEFTLEFDAPVFIGENTSFTYTVNYNYGDMDTPQANVETVSDIESSGGVYGSNGGFGNFIYGGPLVSKLTTDLEGYGENMSILFTFSTRYAEAFTMLNASADFIVLGRRRRG